MFDRQSASARTDAELSVQRLCDLYDRLLAAPDATLTPEASAELTAMAGIFDLDTDRSHAEIWSDLRGVLTRQVVRPLETETSRDAVAGVEPLTLLLVEDDAETAEDLTATLSEAGHRVVGPFHHAEAAEVAAALHSIDLALLDINLSGDTDGIELARSLKSRWGVPVMFLSGDVTAAARHADLAEALVLKPYSGRDVLDAIARSRAA